MTKEKTQTDYDILIAGCGLAGASLACAIAQQTQQQLSVAVVDPQLFAAHKTPASERDMRTLALSYISSRILKNLTIWPDLAAASYAIKKIHVSNQGHFGFTRIDSEREKVSALGYVIEFSTLMNALQQQLKEYSNIDIIHPARVQALDFDQQNNQTFVTLAKGDHHSSSVTAKLIIAADSSNSTIRRLLNIRTRVWDYGQSALVANVGLQRAHQAIAYERFTDTGPLALLPLAEKRYGLVWTVLTEQVAEFMNLDDKEFLTRLQRAFGYRMGKFIWLGRRQRFPLKLIRAQQQTKHNAILIGNASHTIHPIAAQGFNLSLRDVAVLTQIIAEQSVTTNFDAKSVCEQYQKARKWDHRSIIGLTDSLVRIFSNHYQPLALLRNLGLVALDLFPTGKHMLARKTMGYMSTLPELALR